MDREASALAMSCQEPLTGLLNVFYCLVGSSTLIWICDIIDDVHSHVQLLLVLIDEYEQM